jgi:hypothetical protein
MTPWPPVWEPLMVVIVPKRGSNARYHQHALYALVVIGPARGSNIARPHAW